VARRKRRKNPEPFSAKNVVIALAAGLGVYLLVRELRKRGMLGGDGDAAPYTVIANPTPIYNPTVVQTIQTMTSTIKAPPQASKLMPLYDALGAVNNVVKRTDDQVSQKTEALLKRLNNSQITAAQFQQGQKAIKVWADAQRELDKPFISKAYIDLVKTARDAMTNSRNLYNYHGDQAKVALDTLKTALVSAGDKVLEPDTRGDVVVGEQ